MKEEQIVYLGIAKDIGRVQIIRMAYILHCNMMKSIKKTTMKSMYSFPSKKKGGE